MTTRHVVILISSLLVFGTAYAIELNWYTIDGGGTYSAAGNFELEGTIAQPDAGAMSGGTFTLSSGFWSVVPAESAVPGDCDGDGDVDLDDYHEIAGCLDGPLGQMGAGCACLDLEGDGDADLADFAFLQVALTGP